MLARALAQPSNLLVLDEPTNDLDLETLDLLQEMLADYAGTVILVSHDRDFLDRSVTSVIAAEGDGRWVEYAGGYTDMLAQRGAALPGRAAKPAARESAKEPKPASPRSNAPLQKRKLSFREKHALETLPTRIEALQHEVPRLSARLGDPDFFASDPSGFEAAAAALKKAEAELQAAEEEWLRLALLQEEAQG